MKTGLAYSLNFFCDYWFLVVLFYTGFSSLQKPDNFEENNWLCHLYYFGFLFWGDRLHAIHNPTPVPGMT